MEQEVKGMACEYGYHALTWTHIEQCQPERHGQHGQHGQHEQHEQWAWFAPSNEAQARPHLQGDRHARVAPYGRQGCHGLQCLQQPGRPKLLQELQHERAALMADAQVLGGVRLVAVLQVAACSLQGKQQLTPHLQRAAAAATAADAANTAHAAAAADLDLMWCRCQYS